MANYHYDESGVMAAYFVVSVLFIILVPSTFSLLSSFKGSSESLVSKELRLSDTIFPLVIHYTVKSQVSGCQCGPCVDQRARIRKRERGSLLRPKISKLYVACWHFSQIGSIERLAQGHFCHCWLGPHRLPCHTGFHISLGL